MKLSDIKPFDIISQKDFPEMSDEVISLYALSNEGEPYQDMSNQVFEKNRIIFCKTDFLGILFHRISNFPNFEHTLITHHSDFEITQELFNHKPNSIKKWFAQNANVINEDLIPIPIGIESPKSGNPKYKYLKDHLEILQSNKKEFKIYCAWNNTSPQRGGIIEKVKDSNIGYTLESVDFEHYIMNMSKHKFVASPPGNGIDCHRTWEALYIGCIPIVIKNKIYDSWDGLPILQINDWSELTNDLLLEFSQREFDFEKLSLNFWKNRIRSTIY
jgi:hypothetical protein